MRVLAKTTTDHQSMGAPGPLQLRCVGLGRRPAAGAASPVPWGQLWGTQCAGPCRAWGASAEGSLVQPCSAPVYNHRQGGSHEPELTRPCANVFCSCRQPQPRGGTQARAQEALNRRVLQLQNTNNKGHTNHSLAQDCFAWIVYIMAVQTNATMYSRCENKPPQYTRRSCGTSEQVLPLALVTNATMYSRCENKPPQYTRRSCGTSGQVLPLALVTTEVPGELTL